MPFPFSPLCDCVCGPIFRSKWCLQTPSDFMDEGRCRFRRSLAICYYYYWIDGCWWMKTQKQMANEIDLPIFVFKWKIFRSFNFDSMLSNQENFITYCHTRLNLIFAFGEFLHVFFIIVIGVRNITSSSSSGGCSSRQQPSGNERDSIVYTFAH